MHKILVVDDEEKIRRIYKGLLAFERYAPLTASDARSAIELLEREKDVCLVLLDINMPLLNGASLYRVIREVYGRSVKVIVSSVYPLEKQRGLVPGADDYYDKSQGTEVLLVKIKGVLQRTEHSHGGLEK